MEMGKLTAKLRDAVPVCLLVEGNEIKRYRNIEITDELKMLEYQDFKFDVPLNGTITFKIMFEPGVLPEVFPQMRERKARLSVPKETKQQEVAPMDVAVEVKLQSKNEQVASDFPTSVVKALTQALVVAQSADKPVVDIAGAMVDSEATKFEIIKVEAEERLDVITVESEEMAGMPGAIEAISEAEVQPENNQLAKNTARKSKGKNGEAATK